MFAFRATLEGDLGNIEVAFTDSRLDVGDTQGSLARDHQLHRLGAAAHAAPQVMNQVHGAEVNLVATLKEQAPTADALVTTLASAALVVRVADCVPVLLADAHRGIIGVAHAGRVGLAAGVVPATVATMRQQGAEELVAWIGPHICGGCYEVPVEMRAEVAQISPASFAVTRWGTPALDLGSGVAEQLRQLGCEPTIVEGCSFEEPRWHSYRREGVGSGRMAGLIWRTA